MSKMKTDTGFTQAVFGYTSPKGIAGGTSSVHLNLASFVVGYGKTPFFIILYYQKK